MSTSIFENVPKRFNIKRVNSRLIDEIRAITKGITADENINVLEVKYLLNFIKANYDYFHKNIININELVFAIAKTIEDDIITPDETTELRKLFEILGDIDIKTTNELIGFARGITADNILNDKELLTFIEYVNKHPSTDFPYNIIRERIAQVLADGEISADERNELKEVILKLTGNTVLETATFASTLPLDDPQPDIIFQGKNFTFTGVFAYGRRADCVKATVSKGGLFKDNVVIDTDYLVIGTVGNTDWIHSSFGRKIEKAVDFRSQNKKPIIICEDHWAKFI